MELSARSLLLLVAATSQLWCCCYSASSDNEYVTIVRRGGGEAPPAAAAAGELEISLSSNRRDSTNASLIRGEIVSQRRSANHHDDDDNNIETRLDRIRARAASDSSRWRQAAERAYLARQRLAREMALLREQLATRKNNQGRRITMTTRVDGDYSGGERLRRVIAILREKAPIVATYSRSAGRKLKKRADRLEKRLRKIEIRISRGRRRYYKNKSNDEDAASPALRILAKRSIAEAESSAERESREVAAAAEQAEAWVKIITDAAAKEMQLTKTNCTQEQSESVQKLLETVRHLQKLAVEARAQDRNTLEILPNGEVLTKAVGSSILLTCKPQVADTKLISDIQWLDPSNRPVDVLSAAQGYSKPSMYTEIHQDNSLSLFFNSLKEEQAGKYICRAMYANTQLLTKTVTIETIVAITWDNAPENQYPILGEDFAIRCQVRARPSPTVDWLYNGEVIRTNDHYVIETHALRIKNVKESDDGVYTCRASVPQTGELQERTIRVEVHTRPKIEEYDTNVEITEGENANIICKAIGKPPPKFSWIKSLTKENLAITDRFGVNEDTGVLTITNVRREDTGEYQCTATNAAGMDSITIQVTVIVKPKIMEFLNQTVPEGEQTTLACRAFGRPPPAITFRKHTADRPYIVGAQPDDDRIVLRNQADEQKGETLGELIIDQTLRSNDGLYECIATNKGGVAIKNGHLTTEFKPSFASMTNRTFYSWEQRPINLTCIAESIPNATIRWTYYGEVNIDRDPNIVVLGNGPVSTLTITPRDRRYYTHYKCIAVNKHGEAQHTIELREAPKPADVQQVTMIEITATTITFNIVPPVAPVDLPIRKITVQYRKQDTSWQTALNRTWAVIGQQGSYVVENLQPQTNYDFRFAASNEAGRGNWALNKRFTTLMRDVPGPVRFLPTPERDYLVSHFPDRYNLKWSAAPDNGERIDYYDIKWCEAKKYTGNHWEVQDNTCQNKQEGKQDTWINNLYPDTFYKITVRAHNILGLGQSSNMTIKTTRATSGKASVLHHQGSLISSSAIIGIVVAILLILLLIIDAVLCCTCKSGLIYYFCELSRRKPIDEEDAKLGSLYGWRFPLPYCDQKLANVAGVTAIQDSGSGKSTITLVKHTSIDEKEPLREEKMITSIIDTNGGANGGITTTTTTTTTTNGPTVMTNGNGSLGVRESSVTFDGKRSISKTGFVGKDSAV